MNRARTLELLAVATSSRRPAETRGQRAIETGIRRVINMRLKGNGIFWLEDHVEEILQLRALVITNRWDDQLQRLRSWSRKQQFPNWHWTPPHMSSQVESQTTTHQNTA